MAADLALCVVDFARLVSCSTVENWAIWAVHCELSAGAVGSWWRSCSTRSLRNVSLSIIELEEFAAVVAPVIVEPMGLMAAMASGAHVDERPGGELDRPCRGHRGGQGIVVAVAVAVAVTLAAAAREGERAGALLGAAVVTRR